MFSVSTKKLFLFTGEALGALRSSVQQMKQDITRLRKNLVSIESEAVIVLKDANKINEKHQVK